VRHGLNVKLRRRRKDHHGPNRQPHKEAELYSANNRRSSVFMPIKKRIKVGKDDPLQNDRQHSERHDGLTSGKGTHRHILVVKKDHVPRESDRHRCNKISDHGKNKFFIHFFTLHPKIYFALWSASRLPSVSLKIAMKPCSPMLVLSCKTWPPASATRFSGIDKSSPPFR